MAPPVTHPPAPLSAIGEDYVPWNFMLYFDRTLLTRLRNCISISLDQQKQLVAQVLALTPEDIASLPQEQRANIIQLRAQLMGGNV